MTASIWALVAFDVVMLGVLLLIRFLWKEDRQSRWVATMALTPFVFHAVLFFEGVLLYIHLAFLATAIMFQWLAFEKKVKT